MLRSDTAFHYTVKELRKHICYDKYESKASYHLHKARKDYILNPDNHFKTWTHTSLKVTGNKEIICKAQLYSLALST